jgi:hypothetical protein
MIITCPNCALPLYIEAVQCGIFRCGVFRSNGEPIPPHAPQTECEYYVNNQLIYGCGSPFQYNGVGAPLICDYI